VNYRPFPEIRGVTDGESLTQSHPTYGSELVTKKNSNRRLLKHTKDGYYWIVSVRSRLCLNMQQGRKDRGAPVQPGAPITTQTCDGRNTEKWEITRDSAGYTITNAISQMVLNVDTCGTVVQMPPDQAKNGRWKIEVR
jgi:hypothetical protein